MSSITPPARATAGPRARALTGALCGLLLSPLPARRR